MRRLLVGLILVFLAATAGGAPAFAQKADHPWEADTRLVRATEKDIEKKGILSIRSHVDQLEKALAGAAHAVDLASKGEGDTHYALTDGQVDTLAQMGLAAVGGAKGTTLAVANPYPAIAFYLGCYYDEIEKPAEAVRVFDAVLALPNAEFWQYKPAIMLERGGALGQVNRHDDALASYDAVLKDPNLPADLRARGFRGRGFNLTDLGRLDEAEAAYQESLKLEPGNPVATKELTYIAKLKAGGAPTQSTMTKVQPGKSAN